jgi:hypothetical protein
MMFDEEGGWLLRLRRKLERGLMVCVVCEEARWNQHLKIASCWGFEQVMDKEVTFPMGK